MNLMLTTNHLIVTIVDMRLHWYVNLPSLAKVAKGKIAGDAKMAEKVNIERRHRWQVIQSLAWEWFDWKKINCRFAFHCNAIICVNLDGILFHCKWNAKQIDRNNLRLQNKLQLSYHCRIVWCLSIFKFLAKENGWNMSVHDTWYVMCKYTIYSPTPKYARLLREETEMRYLIERGD